MHHDEEENFQVENRPRPPSGGSVVLNLLFDHSAMIALLVMGCGIASVMAVPAILDAREAARREQCKQNLKQLGQALHNYQDSLETLPVSERPQPTGEPITPPVPAP